MDRYNPQKIEPKWHKKLKENPDLFKASEKSEGEKFYCLDMFPYPSGDGLHVGHVESYTATDIISRYMRMNGKNVLHPQGWDAFGLPAENYAIKTRVHPAETTKKAVATFKEQMDSIGFSYDWSREINSSNPEYYKWTQWFFLLLYKNGLAYKEKARVNWCDSCQTVLANEQAEGGICERCQNEVVQKELEQWFFRITDFIEDKGKTKGLINGLGDIDWPESTKLSQKNWIGRSEGVEFEMKITGTEEKIEVYTTRVDTSYGMTYAVVAPEHPLIEKFKNKIENYSEVEKYIIKAQNKTELERTDLQKEKSGVELNGIKTINPFNEKEIPLFVADYVIGHYGTGAVMAVPAHDERDFEFAKKNNLPIRQSIAPFFSIEKGKDKPRKEKPTKKRRTVFAIVKHWEKDEFLCLDWEKFGWKSFIIGGIDNGEDGEKAAIREVKEETGYQNIKLAKKIDGEVHTNFFAEHKDVNRYGICEGYYIELKDGEFLEPSPEHTENHKTVWVEKKNVSEFVNLENNLWYWERLVQGDGAFTEDGKVINSGEFSELSSAEAREKMTKWLEKEGIGKKKINYKLRDWLVSRQRYWGAPIPIIHCKKCGEVPVPEKDLPVVLPNDVDFNPTGKSPLVDSKKFHNVKCPKCNGKAERESDTMDTFVCSSWYYFRYADPKNEKEFASKENIKKWLPVDLYVGGAEHTVLHLLYARFFTKVLHSLGYIDFDEPFLKLRHQGIILAEDGNKMSKSKGNVVNPNDIVNEFGADSLRVFEMFMGPLEEMKPWNTSGIMGIKRFLNKVWNISEKIGKSSDKKVESLTHKTIKKVTEDIGVFRFNTAISQMMILANEMEKQAKISKDDFQKFLLILSPFAPHIAEELWEKLGHKESIFKENWPKYDKNLIQDKEIELVIQINGKLRDRIKVAADISEDEAKGEALQSDKVKKFTEEKEIKKVIFVKGRLINIVVS